MIVRKYNARSSSGYLDEIRSLLTDAGSTLSSAAERLGSGGKAIGHSVGDTVTDSWDYVRERPRSAALAGVAVAVLVTGYLLWRRNHH